VRSVRDYAPQSAGGGATYNQSKISGTYILVPVGLFGALLAGLACWGAVHWYRGRRIVTQAIRAREARARLSAER
jgi:hypothetical protein